ncbi:MAG: hypothetical protein Q9192_004324 [Flavoplaca navasiana]
MALLDLPNELLQCILDASSRPDDFENLAMTCSRLRNLSKSQMEFHNRLKKMYTSVESTWEKPGTPPNSTCKLIQRLQTFPLAAQYVKRASSSITPGQGTIDEQHQALDWPTIVNRLFRESKYIEQGRDLESWRHRMLDRRSGPDVATLLTLLPNVEWLVILGYNWKCPDNQLRFIDTTMHLIVQDAIAGLCHPLSNLRTVFIHPMVMMYDQGFPTQMLAPFIALPSLERLVAYSKKYNGRRRNYRWLYGPHQSNLRTLELFDTVTTALQLDQILQPMHQLRSFKYVHDPRYVDWVPFLDTAGYLRSVIDRVGSTLEDLTFTGRIRFHTAFETFKPLQNLRRLEVRLSLLSNGITTDYDLLPSHEDTIGDMTFGGAPECLPHTGLPCPRLLDILPPTITDLILWCDGDQQHADLLFEGFQTNYRQALPEFQRLNIVDRGDVLLESMLEELRSAGINVCVDVWDRRRQWYDPFRWWDTWDWRGKQIRRGMPSPPDPIAWATSS